VEARVTSLWRHPIKAHGAERISASAFEAGQTMPWDRVWAIVHDASKVGNGVIGWVPCANFSRGAKSPSLMAIRAKTDEAASRVTLTHPNTAPLTVNPDDPAEALRLIDWVLPLSNPGRALPSHVVRAGGNGFTDSRFASVAILNRASLEDLSSRTGCGLAEERFRGNIWLEDLAPWEEFDLVGREIRIGTATFAIRERITRCMATAANPETGRIDADTLGTLEANWHHRDFGIYAEVIGSGRVALGDIATPA